MDNIFERIREIRDLIAKNDNDAIGLIKDSILPLSKESREIFADHVLEGVSPKGDDVAYMAYLTLGREVDSLELARGMLNESKESMTELLSSDILKGLPQKDRYEIMDQAIRLSLLSKDLELICSTRLTIGGMR
jgi:hypothetical protein